jgi:hypothetical protein
MHQKIITTWILRGEIIIRPGNSYQGAKK